ncbi:MAG: primosomal protein N' [Limnohabitans sp.]|nr:primosomal protein N' [Limnohabitans sp.]
MSVLISVVVHTPTYSNLGDGLTYRHLNSLPVGTLVRVPLGSRETLGIVWNEPKNKTDWENNTENSAIKSIIQVLTALTPVSATWISLVDFSSRYYQRSPGEVALSALPPSLRDLDEIQLARRMDRFGKNKNKLNDSVQTRASEQQLQTLTAEQAHALGLMQNEQRVFLLYGNTGSGKTEVYMRRMAQILESSPDAQALIMVPEINLTPQLEQRIRSRFAKYGDDAIVSMHSGMTPALRLQSWLGAHTGHARIVLGTRMAVFASMPHLKIIVVDEEHDPSYKQQEGARYSARDLAVYRGHLEKISVILGSATPSLESWHHSRPAMDGQVAGRYLRIGMPTRLGESQMPKVRYVDMNLQPRQTVFSTVLLDAIQSKLANNEQILILINRRGYAPIIHCVECGWKSECAYCTAYRVFHKVDRTLRCHHCGFTQRAPRVCPTCGHSDLGIIGHGTEQIEESLNHLLMDVKKPDGSAVRIGRIDADTTRLKGQLENQLAQVHAGDIDILIGTQMIAKGHDFRHVSLVVALNPDSALFSSDFRAPERLFSLLLQAAGRAGRDPLLGMEQSCQMWIQTFFPTHPLFEHLKKYDFEGFAGQQLLEREQADMPPFVYQALIRSQARTQQVAQDFLNAVRDASTLLLDQLGIEPHVVVVYPAVAMEMQRVANVERAQMLVESGSRQALQVFLQQWQVYLHKLKKSHKGMIRWVIDVDPLQI